jgi:hypothetical protein
VLSADSLVVAGDSTLLVGTETGAVAAGTGMKKVDPPTTTAEVVAKPREAADSPAMLRELITENSDA